MSQHDSAGDRNRSPYFASPGATGAPTAIGGHPSRSMNQVVDRPELVLAGWWRRAGAQLLDGLIIGIGAILLFAAITATFSLGFTAGEAVGIVAIVLGLLLAVACISVVALLYAPAMMGRTNGRTLGRMATGIRVVRADGRPVTFGFAMVREVAVKALLFGVLGSFTAGLVNLLDYLWPLWDEENRALHDFVVDTRTVLD